MEFFTHISLENRKNFRQVDLAVGRRTFLVGPNASGKSNLLDAIKFLREVADPEGGFQRAVRSRGGVSQIRCLHARKNNDVVIDVSAEIDATSWRYRLEFRQDNRARAFVSAEKVWRSGRLIDRRPTGCTGHYGPGATFADLPGAGEREPRIP